MFHETWLIAFVTTFLVEALVLWAWSRFARQHNPIFLLFAINLTTHPLAYLAGAEGLPFALIEIAVIAVETLGFKFAGGLSWLHSALIALLINGVSMTFSFF